MRFEVKNPPLRASYIKLLARLIIIVILYWGSLDDRNLFL